MIMTERASETASRVAQSVWNQEVWSQTQFKFFGAFYNHGSVQHSVFLQAHNEDLRQLVLTESWDLPASHFAKRPSDLKQNGTQEKTPFSGTVFHTLSHGVLRFVASVSFKNH